MSDFSKWVACWGNATSITDRREAIYAKDVTLRYPIRIFMDGSHLRFRFSNLTGTEPVTLTAVAVGPDATPVTFGGCPSLTIQPGREEQSDAVAINVVAGDIVDVSIYLASFTQMTAGTLVTGPLSTGFYSYGNHLADAVLPPDLTRPTNWFYFLNTVDILTYDHCHAVVCYGDSITAQSWPDYFALRCWEAGRRDVGIIRRAVCGTRILRQYECIAYQAYGLKGATRFPIETNVAGASDVIIQHGINDIIHPVGVEVNPFRPWSDMPSLDDLKKGVTDLYLSHAAKLGVRTWAGTLLPIEGWRTYTLERDVLRQAYNEWLRQASGFHACIDFDEAVRDPQHPLAFAPGFDSGDHLHPSEAAYAAMAEAAYKALFG